MNARLVEQFSQVSMSSRWISGVWALLGAPATIMLVGYSEQALYRSFPNSLSFLSIGAFLPGVCIGLGLLALLSLVKSGWPQRAILAAVYGSVMCILAALRHGDSGEPLFAMGGFGSVRDGHVAMQYVRLFNRSSSFPSGHFETLDEPTGGYDVVLLSMAGVLIFGGGLSLRTDATETLPSADIRGRQTALA